MVIYVYKYEPRLFAYSERVGRGLAGLRWSNEVENPISPALLLSCRLADSEWPYLATCTVFHNGMLRQTNHLAQWLWVGLTLANDAT